MNLSNNIPETKIPGSYTEFNYYAGPNGLPANIQKVLLIGDKSSAGSLAVNKPTAVSRMYKAAKKAWKYAQITLLRHAEVTGSAATWAFTFAGTATKPGKVSVICNGVEYAVDVKTDNLDTVAVDPDDCGKVAVNLAEVINNTPDAPFTAVATLDDSIPTGEVVLTAKCNGAYVSAVAGGLNVSVSSEADGITVGSVTTTPGVGTVNLQTALAAAFPERYHIIVSPVNDATNLGLIPLPHRSNSVVSVQSVQWSLQRQVQPLLSQSPRTTNACTLRLSRTRSMRPCGKSRRVSVLFSQATPNRISR